MIIDVLMNAVVTDWQSNYAVRSVADIRGPPAHVDGGPPGGDPPRGGFVSPQPHIHKGCTTRRVTLHVHTALPSKQRATQQLVSLYIIYIVVGCVKNDIYFLITVSANANCFVQ